MAFIRDYQAIVDSPEVRALYYTEMQREDGHPDFEYSRIKFTELDIEEKGRLQLIKEALDRMNAHYREKPTKSMPKSREEDYQPTYEKPRTRKPFPVKKAIGLSLVILTIAALLWNAPTIISFIQNISQSSGTPTTPSYTNMTLRDLPLNQVNETTIIFGDTDYSFQYLGGTLIVSVPFQWKTFTPTEGETFNDFGIEIKIFKVSSDYISDYIVILVRPTVQDYMLTTFYYTKVNLTLYQTKAVNISSGLINKTNQYWFTYTEAVHPSFSEPILRIQTTSQSKEHYVIGGSTIRELEIETRVYTIDSGYMIIYVKPLY